MSIKSARAWNRRWFLAAAVLAAPSAAAEDPWRVLFDGRSFDGWRITGNGRWSIEDGVIVGRQGENNRGGDIFTVDEFAEFEVECEWKMKWPGNSGLWFRVSGPGTGYQADILEKEPGQPPEIVSGSLYGIKAGMIAGNRDASTVNRDGWNKFRVRAVGDHIVIHLNGRQVVDTRDSRFARGALGFQAHPGKYAEGMEVRVRNVRARLVR
jgi:hypothetical protein